MGGFPHSHGWLPSLRGGQAGLYLVEGLLYWTKEACPYPEEVSPNAHQEESIGEDQPQVYRHQLQVWPWKVSDSSGQGSFHGSPQEGQEGIIARLLVRKISLEIKLVQKPRVYQISVISTCDLFVLAQVVQVLMRAL